MTDVRVRLDGADIDDLLRLAGVVRETGADGADMETVAGRIVRAVHEALTDGDGDPACALVRFYVTHRFGRLEQRLQVAAEQGSPSDVRDQIDDDTRCFTLLATAGTEEEWNDRRRSVDHQAIPLVSEALLERLPMVSGLLHQLGIEAASVVKPDAEGNIERHHRRYDVFHVEDAMSSPFVPAKSFVEEHHVRSALGLGGVLPSGELYCLLLFSRVRIDARTADLLSSLAVTIKAAVVPHTFRIFAA